jgi:hypothetical protein
MHSVHCILVVAVGIAEQQLMGHIWFANIAATLHVVQMTCCLVQPCVHCVQGMQHCKHRLPAAAAAALCRDAFASSRRLALPLPQALQPSAAAPEGPLSIVAASSAALLGGSSGTGSSNSATQQQQPLESQQLVQQQEELPQQQQPGQEEAQQQVVQQQQQQWQDQREQFRQLTSRVQQLSGQIKALTRVSFKAGNWLEQGVASNKYEVVTCFSVSKWVHLNWGDDGLMKLFHKFYRWVPLHCCCCCCCGIAVVL